MKTFYLVVAADLDGLVVSFITSTPRGLLAKPIHSAKWTKTATSDKHRCEQIAAEIVLLLDDYKVDEWGFAAESRCNEAILGAIDHRWLEQLTHNVRENLVSASSDALLDAFEDAVQEERTYATSAADS